MTRHVVPSHAERMATTPASSPPVRPGEWGRHSQQDRARRNSEKYFHSALHRILLGDKECLLGQLANAATSPRIHQVAPTRGKVTDTGQVEQGRRRVRQAIYWNPRIIKGTLSRVHFPSQSASIG
jgi:hypothetical protein